MVWGGRWEGGSWLGTRVHPWRIHVDVWQNQYSKVKLKKRKRKNKGDWFIMKVKLLRHLGLLFPMPLLKFFYLFILYWKKVKVLVTQSSPTLCDLIDCSPPGSSVRGILQAGILEWVAMPSSRGSSWPWGQTLVSWIAGRFFTHWATWEAPYWSGVIPESRRD